MGLIKSECLDQMILLGRESLVRVIVEYVAHYHGERSHQGIDNEIVSGARCPVTEKDYSAAEEREPPTPNLCQTGHGSSATPISVLALAESITMRSDAERISRIRPAKSPRNTVASPETVSTRMP